MHRTFAPQIAALSLAAAVAACAGQAATVAPQQTPAWFQEKLAAMPAQEFPNLSDVPEPSGAALSEAQYRALERDLWNERTRIQASPRSEAPPLPAATAASAGDFERDARTRIETSRPSVETAPPVQPAPVPAPR